MDAISNDILRISRIPAVQTILDVICRTTGMGFAAIARVTENRWVACSVLDHINFGLPAGGELQVETTICHEIRQNRLPVIIDSVCASELYREHHTPRQYGFQSYISMPIFLPGGDFFGTLCAIDPNPARLNTPEITGMFKLFAELIAFHFDTEQRLERSESRFLAERQSAELREQFIAVLGHDLRNPLGAISNGVVLLKEDGVLSDDQLSTVEMIRRSITRMSDLIQDTMDFARGRLGGGITLDATTDANLEPILRQVITEVHTNFPRRSIETHFELQEPVRYDHKRMAQLVTNLLVNAMVHGKADRPVKVSATCAGGTLELFVSNSADPIPPATLRRLFEPFQRGGARNYQKGLGLGLYIASEIAKSHGGTLVVNSDPEETRFTFTMSTASPAQA